MRTSLWLTSVSVALISTLSGGIVRASCECGYLDPLTNAVWTDATISYFNETSASSSDTNRNVSDASAHASDIVMEPALSAQSIYGNMPAGDSGAGQEAWVVLGNHVNPWEEDFGATWRTATSFNNTFFVNGTEYAQKFQGYAPGPISTMDGLGMQVSTYNFKQRVVNGSSIMTRRRDILFGSFRAMIIPAPAVREGLAFRFGASFNESETVDLSVYLADKPVNSTLRYSFSATSNNAMPNKVNLTYAVKSTDWADLSQPQLQRFDWLNDSMIEFRNDLPNDTTRYFAYRRGVNATNIPASPAPVSFRAWANGEASQSQGPPITAPLTTRIVYTRLFFNSSLPSRHADYATQCAMTQAAMCSTEDMQLRQSTPFNATALEAYLPPVERFSAPLWAIIVESVFGVIFLATLAHGIVVRRFTQKDKARKAALAVFNETQPGPEMMHTRGRSTSVVKANGLLAPSGQRRESYVNHYDDDDDEGLSQYSGGASTPAVIEGDKDFGGAYWAAVPELYNDWDSDSDLASSDELGPDEEEEDYQDRLYDLEGPKERPSREGSEGEDDRKNGRIRPPQLPQFSPALGSAFQQQHGRSGSDDAIPGLATPSYAFTPNETERTRHGFNWSTDYREGFPHSAASSSNLLGSESPRISGNGGGETPRRLKSQHSIPYMAPNFSVMSLSSAMEKKGLIHNAAPQPHSPIGNAHNIPWSPIANRAAPPRIIRWRRREEVDQSDAGHGAIGKLAMPVAADTTTRRPSVMFVHQSFFQVAVGKLRNVIFIKESTAKTSTGAARVDYLDGMRGFACLFVSMGHFILLFWYSIADSSAPHHTKYFEDIFRMIFAPIVLNAGLVLGIFFLLPSRTMCSRYLLKGGVGTMADSTIRRIPRLVIPVLGALIANYFLIDINAFKWIPRLASVSWSTWQYFQNYPNVLGFIDSFIALWWSAPPYSPFSVTAYSTGVLWTIPVIVQGMWTCMISALIAHELKQAWKRFTFYALCIFFAWYANSWDMFFMAGLIIADLDANLHYRQLSQRGFPLIPQAIARPFGISTKAQKRFRLRGSLIAWIFFLACLTQQYLFFQNRNVPGQGFALKESGIHPDWMDSRPREWNGAVTFAYTNPKTDCWLFVMSIFLLADLSPSFQVFFRLRLWAFLGKHSMAYFLLHGVLFWTWGTMILLKMLAAGWSYALSVTIVFITSYALLTVFCICFTYTFEYWAILFSKAVWRATSGGLGRKV